MISKTAKIRMAATALTISGAGFVGIAVYEGYREDAYTPVPGDVQTIGFGSTGPDIRQGDKTTPVAAMVRALGDVEKSSAAVRRCAPVPMHQYEFDAFVSITYNIGPGAFCKSSIVKKLNSRDYAGACAEMLRWDKFRGKPLAGLTNRRKAEYKLCVGENND